MNSRGQVFALYLVVLTFVMCLVVIGMYFVQQKTLDSSVILPKDFLVMLDRQDVFDISEENLIFEACNDSLASLGENMWGNESLAKQCKSNFLNNLLKDEKSINFIFDGLAVEGKRISEVKEAFDTADEKINFLNNAYSFGFSEDKKVLKIGRNFDRILRLKADDRKKINFPVDVEWKFNRALELNIEEVKNGLRNS